MSIDLSGTQVFVPQNVLQGADVYAMVQHQSCGGVTEFVGGVGWVQPRFDDRFPYNVLYRPCGEAGLIPRDEESVFMPGIVFWVRTLDEVSLQRIQAGLIQIELPFLVSFAKDSHGIVPDISEVQPNHFADPEAAVEQQGEDAVVPHLIGAGYGFQQTDAFRQGEVARKGFP